jgi:hypothetical protein
VPASRRLGKPRGHQQSDPHWQQKQPEPAGGDGVLGSTGFSPIVFQQSFRHNGNDRMAEDQ